MSGDEKQFTDQQMKDAMRMAVIESKVEDIEQFIPEIFASLKSLNQLVNKIPSDVSLEILACRDKMDADVKRYIHENFIDRTEMNAMETRIEKKISKASWMLSGAISAFMFYDWLSTHTTILG